MTSPAVRCLALFGVLLAVVPAADANEAPKENLTELSSADGRLFDTHFARYGFEPLKSIKRRDGWLQIQLPGDVKAVGQTGLYSYVALAGDFEVEAAFEWLHTPAPRSGYGISCGLAVDTLGPAGFVALGRQFSKDKPTQSFVVIQGKPVQGKMQYQAENWATYGTSGRLKLQREKDEMVCWAATTNTDFAELCRLPFTTATVRQFRIYADPGGSLTPLNVRLGNVHVRAEEITGGFPRRDRPTPSWSWLLWLLPPLAVTAAWAFVRRRLAPGPRTRR